MSQPSGSTSFKPVDRRSDAFWRGEGPGTQIQDLLIQLKLSKRQAEEEAHRLAVDESQSKANWMQLFLPKKISLRNHSPN